MAKQTITLLFILSALLANVANAKEQLTAIIIGSGSPIFNENRASASVLISAGETKILVDMGNGTQANLHKLGVKIRDLSALFVTHHHLDHNEEFVPILINSLLGRDKVTIVGPPNTVKFTEINLDLYSEDIEYRLGKTKRLLTERQKALDIKDIQGGESFSVGGIGVSTIKVPHTIHTIAYRFDYNGQSIVITGDLTYSEDLPALAKDADFMIIDSGGMVMTGGKQKRKNTENKTDRKSNKKGRHSRVIAHLNLADSSSLAALAKVDTLVYTHFVPGNIDTQSSLDVIRQNYSGKVIFSEDLMQLNCTDNQYKIGD